ncbi:hypothetical protein DFH06DRAFT_1315596 [Mycena polygramma]|nr:hypothetical protein DFH06DRAFT_1315596 [Mycena polygramma]
MVLLPSSPLRGGRAPSTNNRAPSTSNPPKTLRDSRSMRRALNALSYLRDRPASSINPAYYAALRAARQPAPPSPPRPRRRRVANKENATTSTASASASTSPPTVTRPTTVTRPPLVTTVAHAPWMRQPARSSTATPYVLVPPAHTSPPPPKKTYTSGSRVPRAQALVVEDLWIDGVEPPSRDPEKFPHEECSVCKQVKSCPVISGCGHSHCYPCIRVCLEYTFLCPTCRTVMTAAPFRCWPEEQCIAHDHPDWNNNSRVDYSFDGLEFPKLV